MAPPSPFPDGSHIRRERWQRLELLLGVALELAPEDRQSYLDRETANSPELRAEVERLVTAAGEPAAVDRPLIDLPGLLSDINVPHVQPFQPGSSLGPYKVVAPIGAGGMGEVYRARDTRLDRDVAIKVLAAHLVGDEAALRRFQREARTVASLSHPNIVSLYDTGEHEGTFYLVSELLEGRTLREMLRAGPLSSESVIDIGVQVARGLNATHVIGVIHRDLKPENLFVTREGVVKILDFGLAKPRLGGKADEGLTNLTAPYAMIGTIDYMSPEQVVGDEVDARTDLFSLGALLHEALTGHHPFGRGTRPETASAILSANPPVLDSSHASPALARIIGRCLAKSRDDRYQNAADLAFALQLIASDARQPTLTGAADSRPPGRHHARWRRAGFATCLGLIVGFAAYVVARSEPPSSPVSLRQLTFGRGNISQARFAPDGQVIVYGASWNGDPFRQYTTRLNSSESRVIDLPQSDLLAVSRQGDLAISMARPGVDGFEPHGTLALVGLSGGAPRELFDDVVGADFGPGGSIAALARRAGERAWLEFPVGTVVYEAKTVLTPRVSPDGSHVCFFGGRAYGTLLVAERGSKARILADGLGRAGNCAWSPDGRVIWVASSTIRTLPGFSGGTSHVSIEAIDLTGKRRVANALAGFAQVQDVAPDGKLLITAGELRYSAHGSLAPGEPERDVSAFDATRVFHLAADGRRLVLWDNSLGAGSDRIFLKPMDGSPPVRLGPGYPLALSPDGAYVGVVGSPTHDAVANALSLIPTGPGAPRTIALPIELTQGISNATGRSDPASKTYDFSMDGTRLLIPFARAAGRPPRVYVHDFSRGSTTPVTPEHVTGPAVLSPDGRFVVVREAERLVRYSVDGGERRELAGGPEPGVLARWSGDGDYLFLTEQSGTVAQVIRRHVGTGTRTRLREIRVAEPAGVMLFDLWISRDGQAHAYTASRRATNVFVMEGLR